MKRDIYSDFYGVTALDPVDLTTGNQAGYTIDMRGYEACTFYILVGSATSAGAMSADNFHRFALELGLPSDAGVSVWSAVVASQILHSTISAGDTLTSGVFLSIASYTDCETTYAVGVKYDGQHRYARINISEDGAPSVVSCAAIAILGLPANWPVNTPEV